MDLSLSAPFCDGFLVGGELGQVYYINESAYTIMHALAAAPAGQSHTSLARQMRPRFDGSEHLALESIKAVALWQEERARQTRPHQPLFLPLERSQCARLGINGRRLELTVEDDTLFALLRPMIAHLDAPMQTRADSQIAVTGPSQEGQYELHLDGELRDMGPDIFYARHMALEGIALASLATPECFALLHAAAVSVQGTGVLLSGPSGVGKTTLLLGLLSAGADFVSDDIVPIVGSDAVVMPVPFAIGVKWGSWKLARSLFPNYDEIFQIRLGDRLVKYFPPLSDQALGAPDNCMAGVIVMPEYDPDAPAGIHELTPLEALTLAANYGSWFSGTKECLQYLAKFYEGSLAATVRYKTLEEGVALTRELVAESENARAGRGQ